jgi:hypothetical protein
MLGLWPGGKELPGKKHRPGGPFSRRLRPASAECGGLFGRPAGRPYLERTPSSEVQKVGPPCTILGTGPAWTVKWKLPHGFCPEGPCPRAWHQAEGHLSVWRPFQSALSGLLFFIPLALPEVMISIKLTRGSAGRLINFDLCRTPGPGIGGKSSNCGF